MTEMFFYHGTSEANAKKIVKEGFRIDTKKNWKVISKKGFVYFSLAYGPFYAMNAGDKKLALIKVSVDIEDLYPEDDFLMRALGKPVYNQEELDDVNFEDYKHFWKQSIKYMGNACARPEAVKIIGVGYFNGEHLIHKCDPVISPMNYKIMGHYYKELSEWLFQGNDVMKFSNDILGGL
jgi:hypothetical protein